MSGKNISRKTPKAVLLGVVAMAAGCMLIGCDGYVGIHGAMVPTDREESAFRLTDSSAYYGEPRDHAEGERVSEGWVELWTGPEGRLLSSQKVRGRGKFSIGYTGQYEPDMRYLLKASAPGYKPLVTTIRPKKGDTYIIIELAKAKASESDAE